MSLVRSACAVNVYGPTGFAPERPECAVVSRVWECSAAEDRADEHISLCRKKVSPHLPQLMAAVVSPVPPPKFWDGSASCHFFKRLSRLSISGSIAFGLPSTANTR